MLFAEAEEALLQWNRSSDQLPPIESAAAKPVPEPEQPGGERQGVAAKPFGFGGPGELQDAQQISFQGIPAL
jgi:hypothetical protein